MRGNENLFCVYFRLPLDKARAVYYIAFSDSNEITRNSKRRKEMAHRHNWKEIEETVRGHSGDGSGMLISGKERCRKCGMVRDWWQDATTCKIEHSEPYEEN